MLSESGFLSGVTVKLGGDTAEYTVEGEGFLPTPEGIRHAERILNILPAESKRQKLEKAVTSLKNAGFNGICELIEQRKKEIPKSDRKNSGTKMVIIFSLLVVAPIFCWIIYKALGL